ncbi:hypothetical protein quinque_013925 [Culex quinquefasciatus]
MIFLEGAEVWLSVIGAKREKFSARSTPATKRIPACRPAARTTSIVPQRSNRNCPQRSRRISKLSETIITARRRRRRGLISSSVAKPRSPGRTEQSTPQDSQSLALIHRTFTLFRGRIS